MTAHDKRHSRASYAGREPGLSQGIPASLRGWRALRAGFDHARDPFISAKLKAMEKTESQRREEAGSGSGMVKMQRPFPDLRPKQEQGPLRASFNQAWLREQRAARLAQLAREAAVRAEERGCPQRVADKERSRTPER